MKTIKKVNSEHLRSVLNKLEFYVGEVYEELEEIDHEPEAESDEWADLYDTLEKLQAQISDIQIKQSWI